MSVIILITWKNILPVVQARAKFNYQINNKQSSQVGKHHFIVYYCSIALSFYFPALNHSFHCHTFSSLAKQLHFLIISSILTYDTVQLTAKNKAKLLQPETVCAYVCVCVSWKGKKRTEVKRKRERGREREVESLKKF